MLTRQLSLHQMTKLNLSMAAELANVASRYRSSVYVSTEKSRVHLGSMIGVLAISTLEGEHCTLEVNGEDEKNAMKAILKAIGE